MSTPSFLPTQPPCSSDPAHLVAVQLEFQDPIHEISVIPSTADIFSPWQNDSSIVSYFGNNVTLSALDAVLQNTFQSLYHLVRMELGVIVENQIYAAPQMYNLSILNVPVDSWVSHANTSRSSTSNATLMSEWKEAVHIFNDSDRVPVMYYLRPVPRLKPLGSAITSVFVSTFAMLSTLWTIFSLVAGTIARSRTEHEAALKPASHLGTDTEVKKGIINGWGSEASLFATRDASKASPQAGLERINHNNARIDTGMDQTSSNTLMVEMVEMKRSLARMRRALETHGILNDGDEDNLI
ncbi:hypothetical protein C8J57DRAFT_112927 [Mycena rebaudengoi]|nr:hypothetical protein C8J57DRAFT_112927 [Mycena rebaudengoi]